MNPGNRAKSLSRITALAGAPALAAGVTAAVATSPADETDIQPMYLLGLHTDYVQDGRVINQLLTSPNRALSGQQVTQLGEVYKQLNSSVGEFGAYTLTASTRAIESNTPGDREFVTVNAALTGLDKQRDALAIQIKNELYNAENWGTPVFGAGQQIGQAQHLIAAAKALAATS